MLMVLELLGRKSCTMPVRPLRYSDPKLGPFYTRRASFVQFLNPLLSLQIPREQVKVLDHPKLQVPYFKSMSAYLYVMFEKHVINPIHFVGWIS
jgi:hypothetical protein